MFLIRPFFITFFALCVFFYSEAGNLKKIRKALESKKFEKAEKRICRSLAKDSLNPGSKFYLSVLLVHEEYSRYDIDSSWYWINRAIADLLDADGKIQKGLQKVSLEEKDFVTHKARVASLAFNRAFDEMSISAFEHYLSNYANTHHIPKAIHLRDSLAYDIALNENTWQAYENYFQTYPHASFVSDARKRYQTLIFKDYTKDDQLESYVKFLEDHPTTPFRRLAEEIIFTRSILDHKWNSYLSFLKKYPETHLTETIGNILYHKSKTNDFQDLEEVFNMHPNPDSLRAIYELEKRVLYPIFEGGVFGFMSTDQARVIKPEYQAISEQHLCGNVTSEWLHVENIIVNRLNETILGGVNSFKDLGMGVAIVKNQENRLYHKSGYRISDQQVSDAKMLTDGIIAFQPDYDWGLMTILGHQLLPPEYESIALQGSFLILQQEDSFKVAGLHQLRSNTGHELLQIDFDDYEVIGDTLFQGFQGDRECLLDKNLNFLIPLDTHTIYVTRHNWYVKNGAGYQLYDKRDTELINQKFEYLDGNEGWITLKRADGWLLISKIPGTGLVMKELDSVRLISPYSAFVQKNDTMQVLFQSGKREMLVRNETVQLLNNQQVHYLLFGQRNSQKVYDASGNLLFTGKDEGISLLGDSTFRYKKNNKFGILDKTGKVLLSAQYDLADENDGLVFLLKGTGIGCYDLRNDLLISPDYQTRIFRFGDTHYKVQNGAKTGLLNNQKKLAVPTNYDELIAWNDTSLWAQESGQWKLITYDNMILMEGIRAITIWFENSRETFATILTQNGLGLLSNMTGEILPSQYNDILNVGSNEAPVFFAEQHLKAASFYVVTYLDQSGQTIRSQAFRPEEYEKIYCDL